MTRPVQSTSIRLLAVEREVRKQTARLDELMKLQAMNAMLAGTNRRLLGEIDAYKRNVEKLQQYIDELKARQAAA